MYAYGASIKKHDDDDDDDDRDIPRLGVLCNRPGPYLVICMCYSKSVLEVIHMEYFTISTARATLMHLLCSKMYIFFLILLLFSQQAVI